MTDLHVGYLVQQFSPEVGAGPARVAEMARSWMRAGARVTVITGMPNRPEGRIHPEYRRRLVVDEERDGMRVLRSWLYASPKHGTARTLLNNVTFMATSTLHALARAGDVDVLIASSPPLFPHIAGRFVSSLRGIPLVLELRDLWPDYVVEMGLLAPGSASSRLLFRLERGLLRGADAVTVVTESFRQRVADKGVEPDRIHLMPAGVDADFYFRSDEPPPLTELRRHADELVVGYLGNFGAGQELGTILDAARALAARGAPVRFVLVGDGPQRASLEAKAAGLALGTVSIHPPIPKELTRAFYANCDLCLVPLAPVPVFQETVPSKIFEIMACERPIVASVDGEARLILEASGAGWTTPPGDAARLADTLLVAARTPRARREEMGVRGRAYAVERYSREEIASRYLSLLERVARRDVAGPLGERPSLGRPHR